MRHPKRLWIGLVGALLIMFPFQETVAPEWHIRVTDESGKPFAGIGITDVWQDYTVENESHEENRRTDTNGRLVFPPRAKRVPMFMRIYGVIHNVASQGAHASFGPCSFLVVGYPSGYGNNGATEFAENEARWFGGQKIVYKSFKLHRCRNGSSGIVCMQP
jgi:hypothetical protein